MYFPPRNPIKHVWKVASNCGRWVENERKMQQAEWIVGVGAGTNWTLWFFTVQYHQPGHTLRHARLQNAPESQREGGASLQNTQRCSTTPCELPWAECYDCVRLHLISFMRNCFLRVQPKCCCLLNTCVKTGASLAVNIGWLQRPLEIHEPLQGCWRVFIVKTQYWLLMVSPGFRFCRSIKRKKSESNFTAKN